MEDFNAVKITAMSEEAELNNIREKYDDILTGIERAAKQGRYYYYADYMTSELFHFLDRRGFTLCYKTVTDEFVPMNDSNADYIENMLTMFLVKWGK